MSVNTIFLIVIFLSSSGSGPLSYVMICWNIVATTVDMFRDELFALGAWTGLNWVTWYVLLVVPEWRGTHFSHCGGASLCSQIQSYVTTDGQTASLLWSQAASGVEDLIFVTVSWGFVHVGRPLWREDESVVYNCCWFSPAQSYLLRLKLSTGVML
jgi:hypothetical protein